ncbi:E3 ubiquitin-protein ligase MIB1 (DAPK-interacting protein 1) (DIP-1) (Mind bomb homolog 1) (RING-type E3 ubiquitin transferase MIB1) (Zinc finger ZZ type with ankyrin repeat domain protein 2) [Durusdinium trenchii]|uniref:E3 ubiquitin-protein ligase MIB1 (DAPK-interacting protein 1) (DIP-1) (Mind bomb homolog 1) (RING-type E3 ubiquitin transferase MIB1) (Zinc finger ZZ type with ankyrin repeat domain protein 2) n=1 Tax=Durusdinium trenchii TaxID=1381693 RepID=A0ABP0MK12_9DINO
MWIDGSPDWTVPPERLEMLQESEAESRGAKAEKFDNKFNILKNLELLRVVGANDRTAVIQLVTVGDGVGTNLADINFQDAQGRQAYHIAILCIGDEEESCSMLRTLFLLKGQINGQDFLGQTPLHLAARIGRCECAKTLLALKAHPGLKDKRGRTPLMVAAAANLDDLRAPPPGVPEGR